MLVTINGKKATIPLILSIYGLVCFVFLFYYIDIPKKDTKYFQSAYTTFEYLIFAFILYSNIKSQSTKKIMIILSVLFIVFQVLYVINTSLKRLDSIPIGIETILIVSYIICFLMELMRNPQTVFLKHYCFWISMGIMIYLCGSFFFYIMIGSLSKEEALTFGKITYVSEIIKNILFAASMFVFVQSDRKKEVIKEIKPSPFLDIT